MQALYSESQGLWTLSIIQNSKITRNPNVSETGSVSAFRWGRRRRGIHLLSSQDGNRSSFQNAVFSTYFRILDDEQSPQPH
jgi:hypothetical protein